jgi:hypothetical protein
VSWGWRVLIAFDMFMNAVFRGKTGQTISSRAADARSTGKAWGCVLCRLLDRLDNQHCEKAKVNDIMRAQMVIDDLSQVPEWTDV